MKTACIVILSLFLAGAIGFILWQHVEYQSRFNYQQNQMDALFKANASGSLTEQITALDAKYEQVIKNIAKSFGELAAKTNVLAEGMTQQEKALATTKEILLKHGHPENKLSGEIALLKLQLSQMDDLRRLPSKILDLESRIASFGENRIADYTAEREQREIKEKLSALSAVIQQMENEKTLENTRRALNSDNKKR